MGIGNAIAAGISAAAGHQQMQMVQGMQQQAQQQQQQQLQQLQQQQEQQMDQLQQMLQREVGMQEHGCICSHGSGTGDTGTWPLHSPVGNMQSMLRSFGFNVTSPGGTSPQMHYDS